MLIKKYNKTTCINGCKLFNDNTNFQYWENRDETTDEFEIVNYINQNYGDKLKKILHIGIGNSFLARNIKKYEKIDGITISGNELKKGESLNIPNYKVNFSNKYSKSSFFEKDLNNSYDFIVDTNLKSFSCCTKAFDDLIRKYVTMLNNKGTIITSIRGMNWSRIVKPVFSFSFSKLFYKKLKEFNGAKINILSIAECKKIANLYNLFLFHNNHILYLKKK